MVNVEYYLGSSDNGIVAYKTPISSKDGIDLYLSRMSCMTTEEKDEVIENLAEFKPAKLYLSLGKNDQLFLEILRIKKGGKYNVKSYQKTCKCKNIG